MPRQPLALGFNEGRSRPVGATRMVNLYMEPGAMNSRAPRFPNGPFATVGGPAYGTPGLKAFAQLAASGNCRAAIYALGFFYVLNGDTLSQIALGGAITNCTGATIPATGVAMLTTNGLQVTILSGGLCFVTTGTTVSQITSTAYPLSGVSSIDTIDGYTLFSTAQPGSQTIAASVNITGITAANPAVVTTGAVHGLANGTLVTIAGVVGMTQVNNRTFTVTVVDSTDVQLNGVDSTAYTAYSSGGTISPVTSQANGQWFISGLYDSTALNALQFATKQARPDPLMRILVANREVLLFGTQSIEPWTDVGSFPFPFQRVTGAIIDRGTAAALSPAEWSNTVYWLGDDLVVYSALGYNPVRISTNAIEEAIRKLATAVDAVGMTYSQGGHSFYVLTFPTGNRTFVYDISTGIWHERVSGTQLTYAAWNVNCLVAANGLTYAGSNAGKFGILDLDTFAEYGQPIRRYAWTQPLYNDGKRATTPVLELECELGVGLSSGQGSAPVVMVRTSDDGGATWSNERQAQLGMMGNRNDRARVFRMGIFRQRMFEFAVSDPVKVAFYGMNYGAIGMNS